MTPLQIELTKLIGKKDLSFGCVVMNEFGISRISDYSDISKDEDGTYNFSVLTDCNSFIERKKCSIIGHPATLSDFHRFMMKKLEYWEQNDVGFRFEKHVKNDIPYIEFFTFDSSKDLLDQSEETLKEIIDLVKKYS